MKENVDNVKPFRIQTIGNPIIQSTHARHNVIMQLSFLQYKLYYRIFPHLSWKFLGSFHPESRMVDL